MSRWYSLLVCNGPETNRQPRRGRGSDRRELWQEVGQTQPASGGDFGDAARVGNVG